MALSAEQLEQAVLSRISGVGEATLVAEEALKKLSSAPDGWRVAIELLLGTHHDAARFFALQILCAATGGARASPSTSVLDSASRLEVQRVLVSWSTGLGNDFAVLLAPFVRVKLAVLLVQLVKIDYPRPAEEDIFEVVLAFAKTGEGATDLLLRVLDALEDDVLSFHVDRSEEEVQRCTMVKEAFKGKGGDSAPGVMVRILHFLLEAAVESMSSGGSSNFVTRCIEGAGTFMGWLDEEICTDPRVLAIFSNALAVAELAEDASNALEDLVKRKMPTFRKVEVIAQPCFFPTAPMQLLRGLLGHSQGALEEVGVLPRVDLAPMQLEQDALLSLVDLNVELLAELSNALRELHTTFLFLQCPQHLRDALGDQVYLFREGKVAREELLFQAKLVSYLTHMVASVLLIALATGPGIAVEKAAFAIMSLTRSVERNKDRQKIESCLLDGAIDTTAIVPLTQFLPAVPPGGGDTTDSFAEHVGQLRNALSSACVLGHRTSGANGALLAVFTSAKSFLDLTAALLQEDGAPGADFAIRTYLPAILAAVIQRCKVPDRHGLRSTRKDAEWFARSHSEYQPGLEAPTTPVEEEEEAQDDLLRGQLTALISNMTRVAPRESLSSVLDFLGALPTPLSQAPAASLDAILYVTRMFLEASHQLKIKCTREDYEMPRFVTKNQQPQTSLWEPGAGLLEMMEALVGSNIPAHPNPRCALEYFELVTERQFLRALTEAHGEGKAPYFYDVLSSIFRDLCGDRGLQHPHSRMRARCPYLLQRGVRLIQKQVDPLVEPIFNVIAPILAEPGRLDLKDALHLYSTLGILLANVKESARTGDLLERTAIPLADHIAALTRDRSDPSQISYYVKALTGVACSVKSFQALHVPVIQSSILRVIDAVVGSLLAFPADKDIRGAVRVTLHRSLPLLPISLYQNFEAVFVTLIQGGDGEDMRDVVELYNQVAIEVSGVMLDTKAASKGARLVAAAEDSAAAVDCSSGLELLDRLLVPLVTRVYELWPHSEGIDSSGLEAPHVAAQRGEVASMLMTVFVQVLGHGISEIFVSARNREYVLQTMLRSVLQALALHGAPSAQKAALNGYTRMALSFLSTDVLEANKDAARIGLPGVRKDFVPDAEMVKVIVDLGISGMVPGCFFALLDASFLPRDPACVNVCSAFGEMLIILRRRLVGSGMIPADFDAGFGKILSSSWDQVCSASETRARCAKVKPEVLAALGDVLREDAFRSSPSGPLTHASIGAAAKALKQLVREAHA
uniref:Exportin-T n=1 Tax=Pinguiococcus pyrenoidosus TaxID=172671 RepID=A0A6U0TXV2_9STRA|mmetsp:Transcript_13064/g.48504  ORF Transcript_13064/g.48504 Transcript_13064/m.48504 type:complete len:1254 (+) Transcript_13064:124-3885(+)